MKTIYVEQYGAWWKLTQAEWQALCESGARGEGHLLPPDRELRHRPRRVGSINYGGNRPSYFARKNDVLVYQPLDWEPENYQAALKELVL